MARHQQMHHSLQICPKSSQSGKVQLKMTTNSSVYISLLTPKNQPIMTKSNKFTFQNHQITPKITIHVPTKRISRPVTAKTPKQKNLTTKHQPLKIQNLHKPIACCHSLLTESRGKLIKQQVTRCYHKKSLVFCFTFSQISFSILAYFHMNFTRASLKKTMEVAAHLTNTHTQKQNMCINPCFTLCLYVFVFAEIETTSYELNRAEMGSVFFFFQQKREIHGCL